MSKRLRFPCTAVISITLAAFAGCAGRSASDRTLEHDASHSVRMARSLVNAGRTNEALATLDEAIAKEPDNGGLHNYYGLICLQAGRYERAVQAFQQALKQDPYLTDAHNNLGTTYLEMDRPLEAEREFQAALADPGYPTPEKVHLNLGLLYVAQGRDEEAVDAFRSSVSIDPKYFKAHYHLASILERIGNLIEAAREYEVAEPAYRNDGEYWYRRGMTYYLLGRKHEAVDSLLRVRTVSPGSQSAARADELLNLLD